VVDSPEVSTALDPFRNMSGWPPAPAFGLTRIRRALGAMGDPQERIPPAIHITGTNGKGSAGAFMRAMAEAAGLRVHVFTSPHLIRVNERIRLAGRLVSDEDLAEVLGDIARRTEGLTYFEALTTAAFCLFAHHSADLCIIEVGAGGAGDATNVMRHPSVCVVTPISRDHEAMFGVSGVAAIARLKAGIFRAAVPVVVADQPALALGVLREQARVTGAPVLCWGEDWRARWEADAFVFEGRRLAVRSPWLGLRGAHQLHNAGVACAALEAWGGVQLQPPALSAGLREATWPARLQKLRPGPLAQGRDVWIDAAHNPGGAASLAAAIRSAGHPGARTAIVFACQSSKDADGMLSLLAGAVDSVVLCPLPDSGGQEGGPGAEPEALARIVRSRGAPGRTAACLQEAVQLAGEAADTIYVCGSLYLCGAALRANGEEIV
jgi:dihydrofolate synthase/folylpolyglutamate synthase